MAFAFEELKVYQKALDFAVSIIDIIDEMDTPRKHFKLIEQIEASSTSVASNTSVIGGTASICVEIWNGIMQNPPTANAPATTEDYEATAAGEVCTFTYQNALNMDIQYNAGNGVVTVDSTI